MTLGHRCSKMIEEDEFDKAKKQAAVKKTAAPAVVPAIPEKKEKTDKEKIIFSDEKIKEWLFGMADKSSSNVCCALYGHDGTAKSGIAMDCRSEQEKKEGYKIIVFDLDGGCAPLKVIYHDNDPNIIIKNPLVRDEYKKVDYEATFTKLKSALDFIERKLIENDKSELKLKAVIFDGIDKFLRICEYKMRDDVGKGVADGIDHRYWKIRNQAYSDIMEQIKLLDVDRYFITHLKEKKVKDGAGNMISDGWIPDWEKHTPDLMFQRVKCFKETMIEDGVKIVYIRAEIEKCKTNLAMEGEIFDVAVIKRSEGKTMPVWNGLFFNRDNTITQKEN